MSSPPNRPPSQQDFNQWMEARMAQQQIADRAERERDIPHAALLWMALTPDWTIPLAVAVGFPTDGVVLGQPSPEEAATASSHLAAPPSKRDLVVELMARMQRHNLIDVCQPFALDQLRPDLALYTMQEVARADTLREYLGSAAGLLLLRTTLATIGGGIVASAQRGEAVPLQVRRWAPL